MRCVVWVLVALVAAATRCGVVDAASALDKSAPGKHKDTWAVLANGSRYWFNYRHSVNIFVLYDHLRRLGVPENQIIVLDAAEVACNPRNPRPNSLFSEPTSSILGSQYTGHDLYGVEGCAGPRVQFRGFDVSSASLLALLTGRQTPGTPMSRRLPTHAGSNVIVYMTGHGGKGFMKFHDKDMLLSEDLGLALDDMHAAGRYREMLLLVDTCEAATMLTGVRAPGITAVASSLRSQSSHSHMHNSEVGISAVDEFAYGVGKAMKEIDGYRSSMTLRQFLGIAASVVQQSDMSVVPPVVDGVREEGYIDARTAAHFMAPPPVPTSGGVVETYPTGLRF